MSRDMQKMMKQAQQMAAELQKAQEELAAEEFEGTAGGGAVKAVVTGDQRVVRVDISGDIFDGEPDADDLEMLGDAVTAAINDALDKGREAQAEALGPLAGVSAASASPACSQRIRSCTPSRSSGSSTNSAASPASARRARSALPSIC